MMTNVDEKFYLKWKKLSWENSYLSLFRLQKRLFKTVFVSDYTKAFLFQKLILNSNSARLLAIREVTQISLTKDIAGIDGKTSLTFTERFELNEYLKLNINNWVPQAFKRISLIKKDGSIGLFNIYTVSDRTWQILIKYCLEPSYEALFSFRNYGFRFGRSIHDVQNDILLNLSKISYGYQKRILKIDFAHSLSFFDVNFLLKRILAPRGIKLGIFRFLKLGFKPFFSSDFKYIFDLNSLLANIMLHGVENLCSSFRFGHEVIFLLKPSYREDILLKKIGYFMSIRGMFLDQLVISLFSPRIGFDFLGWNFKLTKNLESISFPSYDNYQIFLKRVKIIVNNSNYGAVGFVLNINIR